jgi:hypothetical protein
VRRRETLDASTDIPVAAPSVRIPNAVDAFEAFDAEVSRPIANEPGLRTGIVLVVTGVEAGHCRGVASLARLAIGRLQAFDTDMEPELTTRCGAAAVTVIETRDAAPGGRVATESW